MRAVVSSLLAAASLLVASGVASAANNPQVGMDSDGDATFAYTDFRYTGAPGPANTTLFGKARVLGGAPGAEYRVSYGGDGCSYVFYGNGCSPEQVVVAPNGDAFYGWIRGGTVQVRKRSASGTLSAVQSVTTAGADVATKTLRMDIDDQGDLTLVWCLEREGDGNWVAETRTRSAAGSFSSIQTLSSPSIQVMAPDVAVDDDGDAMCSWVRTLTTGESYYQGRSRSAAGTLGASFKLEDPVYTGNYAGSRVAIDEDGDATIAYAKGLPSTGEVRLYSRRMSRTGVLGARRTLDSSAGYSPYGFGADVISGRLDVVAAPTGDSTVAWLDMGNQSAPEYRSATETAAGSAGASVVIGTTAYDFDMALDAAVDRQGDVTFVWNKVVPAGDYAQTRTRSAAGALTATQNLGSAPDNSSSGGGTGELSMPRLAVDDDGDATFVWYRYSSEASVGGESLQTRSRTPAGALGTTYNLTNTGGPPIAAARAKTDKQTAAR